MPNIELLAVVAVLKDHPELGIARGQVGTIVEILSPNAAEVEFVDENGRTLALIALEESEFMRLHHNQLEQAA